MVFPIVLNSPPSVSSMPSFAFFNPSSMIVKFSCTLEFSASIDAVHREMISGKLLLLLDSLSFRLEAKEMINRSRLAEAKGAGMTTRFRISHPQQKETAQLDLVGRVKKDSDPLLGYPSSFAVLDF
ncbi:uncharacterized protein LOC121052426 [Rosa chinensis]|uniref:uncharacterized protein LOC121052426 n=1 Tax=Rosa chinensis TaxID=74649 RepID=UPI001AD9036E|nr:uncharacterized protein LOC121052426 [Rosa chinensis]